MVSQLREACELFGRCRSSRVGDVLKSARARITGLALTTLESSDEYSDELANKVEIKRRSVANLVIRCFLTMYSPTNSVWYKKLVNYARRQMLRVGSFVTFCGLDALFGIEINVSLTSILQ